MLLRSPKDDTPADWMSIHSTNGEIRVGEGATVGCDIPRRDALHYFVKISDGELETENEVILWQKNYSILKQLFF